MSNILSNIFSPELYTWIVIPLLIFVARIADVSFGTVRVIFVSRGLKYLAPIVAFFEVLIWLMAIGQIMKNLSNPVCNATSSSRQWPERPSLRLPILKSKVKTSPAASTSFAQDFTASRS